MGEVVQDTSVTEGLRAGSTARGITLREVRARKFAALAVMFRLDVGRYAEAIDALLVPCPGFASCPVGSGSTRAAAEVALEWVADATDHSSLFAEHSRLFGGEDKARQMPLVTPCAATYMTDEYDGDPGVVPVLYGAVGFEPLKGEGICCPAHISNELQFMAHCLSLDGRDADAVAHAFLTSHLADWGVVFAAATYARSEHPVTRYAGMMLEHLLFCELESARVGIGYYEGIPLTAVS